MDESSIVPPLVLLKDGPNVPPLFFTHGLGGHIAELSKVVDCLGGRPIYGLQWRGLNGDGEPHDSIPAMADYFADAILRLRPNGPYLLAGLSIGGLPMLEVANRLRDAGKEVALVALLDTYPDPRYWPLSCWLGAKARRVKYKIGLIGAMPMREAIPHALKLCGSFWNQVEARLGRSTELRKADATDVDPALHRLRLAAYQGYVQYLPRPYRGRVAFLSARVLTVFPNKPQKIWSPLTPHFEVVDVPCDHIAMITTGARQVADRLRFCMDRALTACKGIAAETV